MTRKNLTIAALAVGVIAIGTLVFSTWWTLTASERATQDAIDSIGSETRKLQEAQEGQQP